MGVSTFERYFRAAAGLDVDKSDLKRYDDFVNRKIYDLFLIAQAVARANGRDVVEPQDLPIGKGLQECIHAFRGIDEEIESQRLLDQLTANTYTSVLVDTAVPRSSVGRVGARFYWPGRRTRRPSPSGVTSVRPTSSRASRGACRRRRADARK